MAVRARRSGGNNMKPIVIISKNGINHFESIIMAVTITGISEYKLKRALKSEDGYIETVNGVDLYVDEELDN